MKIKIENIHIGYWEWFGDITVCTETPEYVFLNSHFMSDSKVAEGTFSDFGYTGKAMITDRNIYGRPGGGAKLYAAFTVRSVE